ncbi:MAG: polysaccharide biosynthesis protein [Oscillospiraceae bacterium]
MSTQRKNDLLRQGSILAVAGILVRLIGILYRIPMSNLLGDVGNGIYSVAYGIYGVTLTLASSSLPLAVSKLIAQRSIQKQHQNAYRLFRIALIFALIVGAAAALFLFRRRFFRKTLRTGRAGKTTSYYSSHRSGHVGAGDSPRLFPGKNTMIPTAVSQLLEQIVNAVVSIAAISWMMKTYAQSQQQAAYGAAGGVMGTLAGALTALVFLIFIFFLCRPHLHRQLQSDPYGVTESPQDIMKALMVTVIPVILSQTVYQIGFTLDDLMFGNLMAAKGVDNTTISSLQGVFNSQYNILINAPVAVATAMASSTIPSIAASTVSGNQKEIHRKVRGVVKFNMAVAIPAAVGLAVLARPILTLLFPSLTTYRDLAANLLVYGSSAVVFFALSTITSAVLQSVNQMRTPVIHGALSMVLHVMLLYLLLRFTDLGIYGLIIGNVTFPMVICALNWRSVGAALSYRQEVGKTFLIPLIASLVMGLLARGTYSILFSLTDRNTLSTAVAILIAVLSYGFCLLRFHCFSRQELYDLPFGSRIVRLAGRLHLLP